MSELKEKLNKLSKDCLVDMILEVSDVSHANASLIDTMLSSHDPKALYKLLGKEITRINAGRKFIGYYEADSFVEELYSILSSISNKLVTSEPDLALKLCKRLIQIDSKLFDRIDDSNGCLGNFYCDLFQQLDRALSLSSESTANKADYLVETYLSDEYGNRGWLFDHLKESLTEELMLDIENRLPKVQVATFEKNSEQYFNDLKVLSVHKRFADKRNDVDKYIELTERENIHSMDILEIAKRLNNAFRANEAITWLLKISEEDMRIHERDELLIEAYKLEGLDDKAKEIIWSQFKRTLSFSSYLSYIKNEPADNLSAIQNKAVVIATKHSSKIAAMDFLCELGEYNELEQYYIKNEQNINFSNYSSIRKLSKRLFENGKPLIATLMRRELIEAVLAQAKAKYYKYAVSDFNMAKKFSLEIGNWLKYPPHNEYYEILKNEHSRKTKFWALMNESGN